MYENTFPDKRFKKTLEFLESSVAPPAKVLDLGVDNPFAEIMRRNKYTVTNTSGEDLDENTEAVRNPEFDVVTAFEIFEHLVAPYNILKDIEAPKLVATVPLNLWCRNAYRIQNDMTVWLLLYVED